MSSTFLLYGANGYTGELITRYAAERGMMPILAGRNGAKVAELAGKYGFEYRVFALNESAMLDAVNDVEYGLTCAIWTQDISTAHRTAMAVQAGYVWINEVGKHFLGAPFGGVKQSGFGREECLEEMLRFTQEKNVHIKLRPTVA